MQARGEWTNQPRVSIVCVLTALAGFLLPGSAFAAGQRDGSVEARSGHVAVVSNAGEGGVLR